MRCLLFVFLGICGVQAISSPSLSEVLVKIEACGEISRPLKRLDCFDRLLQENKSSQGREINEELGAQPRIGESNSGTDKNPVSPTNSALSPSSKMRVVIAEEKAVIPEDFGAVTLNPEAGFSVVIERVIKLSRGNYRLVLEGGQVWEEIEHDPRTQYSIGDSVVIKRGVLGTYNIVSKRTSRKNKVKRIK